MLCTSGFTLDYDTACHWWHALESSTHPKAHKVYRHFARYRGTAAHFPWFVFHQLSAKDLITACEPLVEAGSLTRREATAIEEGILRIVRYNGAWK